MKKALTFFIDLKFFYEHVNVFIVIVYLTLQKEIDLLCWVYKKKKFFSLFSPPDFSFENSEASWNFLRGGKGWLAKMNVHWGGYM